MIKNRKTEYIYELGENLYKKYLPSKKINPLYSKWQDMKSRCYAERNKSFYRYGGRGITVCDEWRNSFENFADWAIICPSLKSSLQIDRINNDGNYEPENCRFVTRSENIKNRKATEKQKNHCRKIGKQSSKRIVCVDTGEIFDSIGAASQKTKIHKFQISACCSNKIGYETAGGYTWIYFNEIIHNEGNIKYSPQYYQNNKIKQHVAVIRLNDEKRFNSLRQAAKEAGISRHLISKACKNNDGWKFL